jgi:hypothetical protein
MFIRHGITNDLLPLSFDVRDAELVVSTGASYGMLSGA